MNDPRFSVALVALGVLGSVLTSLGAFPGAPPWLWPSFVVLGLARPALEKRLTARAHDRKERILNAKARRNLLVARKRLERRADAYEAKLRKLDRKLARTLSPAMVQKLVKNHNGMASDLEAIKAGVAPILRERGVKKLGQAFTGEDDD